MRHLGPPVKGPSPDREHESAGRREGLGGGGGVKDGAESNVAIACVNVVGGVSAGRDPWMTLTIKW